MISNFDPNIKVTFTPTAINKIAELTRDGEYIRMYVIGGGCSGFQYMFDIVKEKDEDEDDIFIADVNVLIDPLSYQYIENSEVDYESDLMGSKFVVKNPQAKTTCGCGQSFSI